MDWGGLAVGVVFFLAPAVWILFDSAKRYGKASWLLALLLPVSFYLTLVAYLIIRFTKKPIEGGGAPAPWQTGAVVLPIVLLLVGVYSQAPKGSTTTAAVAPPKAEAPKQVAPKPKAPVDHYKEAIRLGGQSAFTKAIKELYFIPKGHPDYRRAQAKIAEYKAKEAQVKRAAAAERAKQERIHKAADAQIRPASYLKIVKSSWSKGGFDTVCMANVTIKNTSPIPIGDIKLRARVFGESGTEVGSGWLNSKVLTKVVQPGQTRTFYEVNMGFISDQAESASFEVLDAKAF